MDAIAKRAKFGQANGLCLHTLSVDATSNPLRRRVTFAEIFVSLRRGST